MTPLHSLNLRENTLIDRSLLDEAAARIGRQSLYGTFFDDGPDWYTTVRRTTWNPTRAINTTTVPLPQPIHEYVGDPLMNRRQLEEIPEPNDILAIQYATIHRAIDDATRRLHDQIMHPSAPYDPYNFELGWGGAVSNDTEVRVRFTVRPRRYP